MKEGRKEIEKAEKIQKGKEECIVTEDTSEKK